MVIYLSIPLLSFSWISLVYSLGARRQMLEDQVQYSLDTASDRWRES